MNDDISTTVAPRSDQLNADDLIAGKSLTITITGLKVKDFDPSKKEEQPTSIHFEGDNGKPWKPCKSMRRLMLIVWGSSKGGAYINRKLRLFNDESVTFGADKTGGIRISHMSHIDREYSVPLTATRGKKKLYTVRPLPSEEIIDVGALLKTGTDIAAHGIEPLKEWWKSIGGTKQKAIGGVVFLEELKKIAAANTATAELPPATDSAIPDEPTV